MTTEIKTRTGRAVTEIGGRDEPFLEPGEVRIVGSDGSGWYVPRSNLLAAVAAECNVIIIDKTDLPDVQVDACSGSWPLIAGSGFTRAESVGPNSPNGKSDWHRARAVAHLALAEYLDANPPVDEAQVEALSRALADEGLLSEPFQQIARRLVAQGWTKP